MSEVFNREERSETPRQNDTNYFLLIMSMGQRTQSSCTLVSFLNISNTRVLIMVGLKVSKCKHIKKGYSSQILAIVLELLAVFF